MVAPLSLPLTTQGPDPVSPVAARAQPAARTSVHGDAVASASVPGNAPVEVNRPGDPVEHPEPAK